MITTSPSVFLQSMFFEMLYISSFTGYWQYAMITFSCHTRSLVTSSVVLRAGLIVRNTLNCPFQIHKHGQDYLWYLMVRAEAKYPRADDRLCLPG